jgi:hypothetical protein
VTILNVDKPHKDGKESETEILAQYSLRIQKVYRKSKHLQLSVSKLSKVSIQENYGEYL